MFPSWKYIALFCTSITPGIRKRATGWSPLLLPPLSFPLEPPVRVHLSVASGRLTARFLVFRFSIHYSATERMYSKYPKMAIKTIQHISRPQHIANRGRGSVSTSNAPHCLTSRSQVVLVHQKPVAVLNVTALVVNHPWGYEA